MLFYRKHKYIVPFMLHNLLWVTRYVTNRPTRETIDFISDGKVDIGWVFLPVNEPGLRTVEMLEIQDCLVVGKQATYLAEAPLPVSSLHEYPLIVLEKQIKTRDHLESFFLHQSALLHPIIKLSSLDLIVEFAKTGFEIGAVIKEFGLDELEQKAIYELRTSPPMPKRTIGFVYLREVPLSWAAKEFINHSVHESRDAH